jgi:peroxiredoxin
MYRFAAAVLVAGLALVSVSPVQAQNKKIKPGDQAPVFKSLPGVDGKSLSLDDLKNKDVVVVAITCNHCPVAVAYEDRFIAFAKKYGAADSKVAFVAINVNNLAADKLDKMKIRAQEKGFNFPYLYDETQAIGRALGATVTPELFVLDKSRKVVYTGSFDNNQNAAQATTNYVEQAVQAALSGSVPATAQTRPFGCSVKYDGK